MSSPAKLGRRSLRLKGYDYTQTGAYFVTICTADNEFVRACTGEACLALNSIFPANSNPNSINIFGQINNGKMILNEFGRIVERHWLALPEHHPFVGLDEFAVMPNHVHFIVCINGPARQASRTWYDDEDRARQASPVQAKTISGSLGAIVGSLKSNVTRHINEYRGTPGGKLWQRNYYDRIIRSQSELQRIREYIINNPANWNTDENNPNRISNSPVRARTASP